MKKYFIKLLALLVFTSVALESCSMQYRENRRKRQEQGRHDHDHDHDNDHHNYRGF